VARCRGCGYFQKLEEAAAFTETPCEACGSALEKK
jgi:hypothetical protein